MFLYLMKAFVGFYLQLVEYKNKLWGYEWVHEIGQRLTKYHYFLGIARTVFPRLSRNMEIFM